MPDSTTCVHEAAHVAVGLSLGIVPDEIIADGSEGRVTFHSGMSDRSALLVGMSGDVACEMLLGVNGTRSAEDDNLSLDHWRTMLASGHRQQTIQAVTSEVWSKVASLQPQILAIANHLLDHPRMSRDDLASLCRRHADLKQYAGLFPARTQTAKRRPTGKPSMASSYLQKRLLQGRGRMPASMTHGQVISNLRGYRGSR